LGGVRSTSYGQKHFSHFVRRTLEIIDGKSNNKKSGLIEYNEPVHANPQGVIEKDYLMVWYGGYLVRRFRHFSQFAS
jgi:hypothetical protein